MWPVVLLPLKILISFDGILCNPLSLPLGSVDLKASLAMRQTQIMVTTSSLAFDCKEEM